MSPHFDSELLSRGIGIRFKGEVRTIDIERPGSPLAQLLETFVAPGEEQEQVARDPFAKLTAASSVT